MEVELLESIGLTKSEIKVYYSLLELGSSSTGKIVDKSGVASSKIYEILDKLLQKGLVKFIVQSGVKHFEAAPPKRILDYVQEKEETIIKQREKIKSILPQLELKQTIAQHQSEASIYKGYKGVESAFYDALSLLKKGDEFLVWGIPKRTKLLNRFFVAFGKERARRKIKFRAIFNESARYDEQANPKNNPLSELKFVPHTTPAAVNIFNDRVIILPEAEDIILFVIDSKEVADSFRVQFENLWSQEIHTYNGKEQTEYAYQTIFERAQRGDHIRIFAAKPSTQESSLYNLKWNEALVKKGVKVELLYYGNTQENKERMKELSSVGCTTKVLPTQQKLPISTIVTKDLILNSVWTNQPLSFKIENEAIADLYRSNFDLLWNQDVRVMKGFDNCYATFDDMLDELDSGEEYYVLGGSFSGKTQKIHSFYPQFHRRRIQKKVHVKFLFVPEAAQIINRVGDIYSRFAEVRYLPEGIYEGMQINLYRNKVLFFVWREKDPIVFTVEDPKVFQTFKTYFDTLWQQDTKVLKGLDAIQDLFEEILAQGEVNFIGARGYFIDKCPTFMKDWEKRAIQSRFRMRNIVDASTAGHPITQFPFADTKYHLPSEFSALSVFWIYGNKVAISNWAEEEPTAIVIENATLHKTYKQQFELLWNQENVTYRGEQGVRLFFDQLLLEKEVWYIGGNWGLKKYFPQQWKTYKKKWENSSMRWNDLLDYTVLADENLKKQPHYRCKVLPKDLTSPAVICIYGDCVANIFWDGDNTAINVMRNKGLQESYLQYFEYLWNQIP